MMRRSNKRKKDETEEITAASAMSGSSAFFPRANSLVSIKSSQNLITQIQAFLEAQPRSRQKIGTEIRLRLYLKQNNINLTMEELIYHEEKRAAILGANLLNKFSVLYQDINSFSLEEIHAELYKTKDIIATCVMLELNYNCFLEEVSKLMNSSRNIVDALLAISPEAARTRFRAAYSRKFQRAVEQPNPSTSEKLENFMTLLALAKFDKALEFLESNKDLKEYCTCSPVSADDKSVTMCITLVELSNILLLLNTSNSKAAQLVKSTIIDTFQNGDILLNFLNNDIEQPTTHYAIARIKRRLKQLSDSCKHIFYILPESPIVSPDGKAKITLDSRYYCILMRCLQIFNMGIIGVPTLVDGQCVAEIDPDKYENFWRTFGPVNIQRLLPDLSSADFANEGETVSFKISVASMPVIGKYLKEYHFGIIDITFDAGFHVLTVNKQEYNEQRQLLLISHNPNQAAFSLIPRTYDTNFFSNTDHDAALESFMPDEGLVPPPAPVFSS